MATVKGLKRTQVEGKKYDLPIEEINIQKLIKKGISLEEKINGLKQEFDAVKAELITIAERRRDGSTTVTLKAVSGASTVTFRESYVCDERINDIQQDIGSLFERFFTSKTEFKATKELKNFLEGEHAFGLDDPESMKKLIQGYVSKKETKPNVKLTPDA